MILKSKLTGHEHLAVGVYQRDGPSETWNMSKERHPQKPRFHGFGRLFIKISMLCIMNLCQKVAFRVSGPSTPVKQVEVFFNFSPSDSTCAKLRLLDIRTRKGSILLRSVKIERVVYDMLWNSPKNLWPWVSSKFKEECEGESGESGESDPLPTKWFPYGCFQK